MAPSLSPVPTIPPTLTPTSSAPSVEPTSAPTNAPTPDCADRESLFKLLAFDTGGDGWGGVDWAIVDMDDDATTLAEGTLSSGGFGITYLCLGEEAGVGSEGEPHADQMRRSMRSEGTL